MSLGHSMDVRVVRPWGHLWPWNSMILLRCLVGPDFAAMRKRLWHEYLTASALLATHFGIPGNFVVDRIADYDAILGAVGCTPLPGVPGDPDATIAAIQAAIAIRTLRTPLP